MAACRRVRLVIWARRDVTEGAGAGTRGGPAAEFHTVKEAEPGGAGPSFGDGCSAGHCAVDVAFVMAPVFGTTPRRTTRGAPATDHLVRRALTTTHRGTHPMCASGRTAQSSSYERDLGALRDRSSVRDQFGILTFVQAVQDSSRSLPSTASTNSSTLAIG